MELIKVDTENTRRKAYRVDKNGRLYLYQDLIKDTTISGGETYIVETTESSNQILLRRYDKGKTYLGVKLTKSQKNIFFFNLKHFLAMINIPFPCICVVEKTNNPQTTEFKVIF